MKRHGFWFLAGILLLGGCGGGETVPLLSPQGDCDYAPDPRWQMQAGFLGENTIRDMGWPDGGRPILVGENGFIAVNDEPGHWRREDSGINRGPAHGDRRRERGNPGSGLHRGHRAAGRWPVAPRGGFTFRRLVPAGPRRAGAYWLPGTNGVLAPDRRGRHPQPGARADGRKRAHGPGRARFPLRHGRGRASARCGSGRPGRPWIFPSRKMSMPGAFTGWRTAVCSWWCSGKSKKPTCAKPMAGSCIRKSARIGMLTDSPMRMAISGPLIRGGGAGMCGAKNGPPYPTPRMAHRPPASGPDGETIMGYGQTLYWVSEGPDGDIQTTVDPAIAPGLQPSLQASGRHRGRAGGGRNPRHPGQRFPTGPVPGPGGQQHLPGRAPRSGISSF